MYIYIRTEFSPYQLYTVGHYDSEGRFIGESDWGTTEEAAKRARYLNGGRDVDSTILQEKIVQYQKAILKAEVILQHYSNHKKDCPTNAIYGCDCGYAEHFNNYNVAIHLAEKEE